MEEWGGWKSKILAGARAENRPLLNKLVKELDKTAEIEQGKKCSSRYESTLQVGCTVKLSTCTKTHINVGKVITLTVPTKPCSHNTTL